jgi:hypothetical protein
MASAISAQRDCGKSRPHLSFVDRPMPHLIVFLMLFLLGLLVACVIA